MARTQGDSARSDEASRRAKELEPILSHITITVTVRAPGLRLQRDDVILEDAALASEIPVDPGQHVMSASAPGYTVRGARARGYGRGSNPIGAGATGARRALAAPGLEKKPTPFSAAV